MEQGTQIESHSVKAPAVFFKNTYIVKPKDYAELPQKKSRQKRQDNGTQEVALDWTLS